MTRTKRVSGSPIWQGSSASPKPDCAANSSPTTLLEPQAISACGTNLTPDKETGRLQEFTEQQFIQTLRTGRHRGQGREILPPMPWRFIGQMTDDDLKAVFAYLRQIPAVKNKVPDPLPPAK
jgi:hypothetical protein